MHARFLHQFAFTGDAVQIANQQDAQLQLGINRRATDLAVGILQAFPHKLKTDVLVDQSQQMVFRNLIFQTEVIEQRLRTVVPSHHNQQASEDSNPVQHRRNFFLQHAFAKSHPLISVTFSTPTPSYVS